MKNLPLFFVSLLFAVLVIPKMLICQQDIWSDPVAISDSVSDNKNPVIRFLNLAESGFYMFWENSDDTLSTAIYYKKFYQDDEPHVFLSDEGVHYTHPQPVLTQYSNSNDTLFYIFYESDEDGTNNIYFRVYNESGFTEAQALSESTAEKTDLQVNLYGNIVWLEQDQVMFSKLDVVKHTIEEPVIIDSGNCSYPSVMQAETAWGREVCWMKKVNDSSRILVKKYDLQDGWLDPEVVFKGPECQNLSYCTGIGPPEIVTWDYFNDTSWHIVYYDLYENREYIKEFDQSKPFHSKFYSGYFPVNRFDEAGFSGIIYTDTDAPGVYSSPYYYGIYAPLGQYENVSVTSDSVINQQFFTGQMIGCNQYIILIWQEWVNGHWQLKTSTTSVCLSRINENNDVDQLHLTTSPNPFFENVKISFVLNRPDEVTLSVYNVAGVKIATIEQGELDAGKYVYRWNGNQYPPGMYFVQLKGNAVLATRKIVLSK